MAKHEPQRSLQPLQSKEGSTARTIATAVTDNDSRSTIVLPSRLLAANAAYQIAVRASNTNATGDWALVALSLTLLAAPTGLSLMFADPTLTAQWELATNASGYEARVLDSAGVALSPAPNINITDTTATITAAALESGGQFQVQVRAKATRDAGPWSTAAQITIAGARGAGRNGANGGIAARGEVAPGDRCNVLSGEGALRNRSAAKGFSAKNRF